jgi:hypothetical protein
MPETQLGLSIKIKMFYPAVKKKKAIPLNRPWRPIRV